jgi:hypothetical protein
VGKRRIVGLWNWQEEEDKYSLVEETSLILGKVGVGHEYYSWDFAEGGFGGKMVVSMRVQ